MQKLVILTLTVLLVSGLGISYLMYRQLGTDSEMLSGTPELVANGNGAECGEVAFSVGARSIGKWFFEVPKAKTITGTVSVGGDASRDVGFSIWSPTNRVVLFEPDRTHELDFEVVGTIRGEYRFDFDNRHSGFTDKKITISLCLA